MGPLAMKWKAQPISGLVSLALHPQQFRRPWCIYLFKSTFSLLFMCSLQDSYRRTSATMCLAVWRSSSLSAALATGTAVMTGNQFVGQTASSTRTCVRWRCLPVETGRASSRFCCPSVLRVRVPSLAQSDSTWYCDRLRSTSWFMCWKSAH